MGCDFTRYPNYGPLSRKCRRPGLQRACGHRLCDRHAQKHESVCVPPSPIVESTTARPVLGTPLRQRAV
jgi:hypothetical protein